MEMQHKLTLHGFQTSTFCAADFLASLSRLLESEGALQTLGAHSFMKLQESLKLRDLGFYSLKTLRGYSVTTKGELSPSSSIQYGNWGMMLSSEWLIAGTSEYHRTGNESSLLDVLETEVEDRYFLSDKAKEKLVRHGNPAVQQFTQGTTSKADETNNTSLNRWVSESVETKES
jgi:hypothetical protein